MNVKNRDHSQKNGTYITSVNNSDNTLLFKTEIFKKSKLQS